jgi:hypothetical protein
MRLSAGRHIRSRALLYHISPRGISTIILKSCAVHTSNPCSRKHVPAVFPIQRQRRARDVTKYEYSNLFASLPTHISPRGISTIILKSRAVHLQSQARSCSVSNSGAATGRKYHRARIWRYRRLSQRKSPCPWQRKTRNRRIQRRTRYLPLELSPVHSWQPPHP